MENKKRRQIKFIMCFLIMVCVGVVSPKRIAFAGDINGNEARVISAASGTFSYNGKEYKAGSSYLNSLASYLSSDDVDLTAEQADEAISMMYASIADGVTQGYLYDINADTTEESTTEEKTEEWADAEADDDEEKDKKKETASDNPTDDAKQHAQNELDVWEAMSSPSENKNKLEQRPEKADASAAVQLEEEQIVVTTKDNKAITISKTEPIVSEKVILVLSVVVWVITAIAIVCGVILFAKECMSFKKNKGRKARPGHSKRRKIRRYTRGVLTVTTASAVFGLSLLLGLYVSLFNNDVIMQNMQSSGYFRYAYSQYIAEQADVIIDDVKKSVTSDGLTKETTEEASEIQTYDEYLFTIKQNSLKVLEGNMDIIIPDSNVAPYIYNLKLSFMEILGKAGIPLVFSAAFGVFLMVFMDQRRERGVKHTAVALLFASGVMAILTLIMLVYKPYTLLYIEPDYLYLFLMECIKRCVTALTSVTAFGVVLGMITIGVFKTMCNK